MSTLTENDIRSTIWFAMGVTEGAAMPFSITVAANGGYGGTPIQNSGYSLGMLQFDFGQHSGEFLPGTQTLYTKALFDEVNVWASNQGKAAISLTEADFIIDIKSNRNSGGLQWLPKQDWDLIRDWGQGTQGQDWITKNLDGGILTRLTNNATDSTSGWMNYSAIASWSRTDTLKYVAVMSKADNQNAQIFLKPLATYLINTPNATFIQFMNQVSSLEKPIKPNSYFHGTKAANAAELISVIEFSPVLDKLYHEIAPKFASGQTFTDREKAIQRIFQELFQRSEQKNVWQLIELWGHTGIDVKIIGSQKNLKGSTDAGKDVLYGSSEAQWLLIKTRGGDYYYLSGSNVYAIDHNGKITSDSNGTLTQAQQQHQTDNPLQLLSHWMGLNIASVTDVKQIVAGLLDNGQQVLDRINPVTFDLNVDPAGLKAAIDALGSSNGGQGLLGAGPGYQYSMPSEFVNGTGWSNNASSGMSTDMGRPGNQSNHDLEAQVNALRATNFSRQESLQVFSWSAPVGDGYSLHQNFTSTFKNGQTVTYSGTIRYDSAGNAIEIIPDAGQTLTIQLYDGSLKTLGSGQTILLGANAPQAGGGWRASGLAIVDSKQLGNHLQFVNITKASQNTDPVILDADKDGVLLSASSVNFDLNADGNPEPLPWTAPTDPLLVLDGNGDGRINNGSELVDLTNGGAPLNLFTLDDNGDNKLDNQDAAYFDLQLWADRNQDGYASPEERQSLANIGIVSIDLNPAHLKIGTVAGQTGVKGVIATYADGRTRTLWDLPLTNAAATAASSAFYSPGIDKVTGSEQTALVAKTALGITLDLNGSGADQAIGSFGNDTLIGTAGDDWLIGGGGSDRFQGGDGRDLLIIDSEDQPVNIDAGSDIDTVLVADDRGVFLNLAAAHVEVVYGGYGDDVFVGGGADNYFISAAAGDDLIIGGSSDDVLSGEDGDDVVQGGNGDDLIRGHRGADQLLGGAGNDVMDGGLDNDSVLGGDGNDVIIASGGTDAVDGGAGIDLIELQGGLEDYTFAHNTDGSWTVTDHYNSDGSSVATGQVSNCDGSQQLKNVERFSVISGQSPTVFDFTLNAPLPVNDQIKITTGKTSYILAASAFLANDLDFQNLTNPQLSIYWVGDAVGGKVTLSADKKNVIFTPTPGYMGILEFAYKIKDAQGNIAPIIKRVDDPSISSELKGRIGWAGGFAHRL